MFRSAWPQILAQVWGKCEAKMEWPTVAFYAVTALVICNLPAFSHEFHQNSRNSLVQSRLTSASDNTTICKCQGFFNKEGPGSVCGTDNQTYPTACALVATMKNSKYKYLGWTMDSKSKGEFLGSCFTWITVCQAMSVFRYDKDGCRYGQ